jgi:protocatechuate 3,4-dioxygenase beta subunit
MVQFSILKGTVFVVGILLIMIAPLVLSANSSGQSALAQDTDTLFSQLPPPGPFDQLSAQQVASSTNKSCTLTPSSIEVEGTPQQTEGPYFGTPQQTEGPRSDIRFDTSDGLIEEGIELQLIMNVYGVGNDGYCIPFSDTKVDIWHANSQGVYSGVTEQGTEGNNFLRGYQIADDNGTVQFTTVYPGWYEGRAIHIHVKVRSLEGLQDPFEWTSQLYLDNSINEQVHKQPPYSNHGPIKMLNEEDGIFAGPSTDGLVQTNSGEHLMLNLTEDVQGYIGTFNIGVNANRSEA